MQSNKAFKIAEKRITAHGDIPLRLDIGCGARRTDGHVGIDICECPGVDHVMDVRQTPWPIDDGAVESIHTSHFFEHLSGPERVPFMEECYRVLKDGGQMVVVCPHWNSMRAYGDPSHQWPPICEWTFLYFNKGWRETNLLTHGMYDMKCDFDFSYGYALDQDLTVKNNDYQQMAIKHYNNAVMDIHLTLTKRPK
jgi:SAM-dependent methyltransferase